jgi:hypothetical protein
VFHVGRRRGRTLAATGRCEDVAVEARISIPTELRRPHRLVAATRDAAVRLKPREDGRLEVGPRKGVAHLVVTRGELRRALLVLHAIAAEAIGSGYEIAAVDKDGYGHRAGVAVVIRDHAYTVEISEDLDRVPLSATELAAWHAHNDSLRFAWERKAKLPQTRGVPNGRLRVSLPSRWHGARSSWVEGRKELAAQLPLVFAELERRADEDDRRAEERKREQAERAVREHEQYERQQRQRLEDARIARLTAEIGAWRLAQESREYISALRARLDDLDVAERARVAAWCDWVDEWNTRSDPTINVARVRGLDDERDRLFYPSRP